MLQVDLRELTRGPVETIGEIAESDPRLRDLDVALSGPVRVRGRLHAAGEGRFYWDARLETRVQGECRRCLEPVAVEVQAPIRALFVQGPEGEDDPEAYPVPEDATEIDLVPAVREELILGVPQFVQCREDCRGLCPQCGKNLNAGPCDCTPPADPRWTGLAALKRKQDER
ncbi:MAG TPA: DUF177 domain-containing protein [Gemmatimonadales bacterium]|nr:DUF177 domain-containing protein [Gemmatimonadales bacterium]